MKGALNLDVFIKDKDLTKKIRNSIKLYRYVASKVFSALALSEFAGSSIEEKKPKKKSKKASDTDESTAARDLVVVNVKRKAHEILEDAFGKKGKACAYPCREWVLNGLAPRWYSFVWDQARKSVEDSWKAKDAEFNVTRGFLILNGARSIARFANLGIGFPIATARPKLVGRHITLKWDHDIGPVTFNLNRMDGGRWFAWKNIVEGHWKQGTLYLNERDGKLRVTITYERPDEKADLDPEATMDVYLPDAESRDIRIEGASREQIPLLIDGPANALMRLRKQMLRLEREKASVGSPVREWGCRKMFKAIQQKIHRLAVRRERLCKDWNHQWSRRIEREAWRARCGRVVIHAPVRKEKNQRKPTICSTVGEESWPWAAFIDHNCKYKVERIGATLEVVYEDVSGSPSDPKERP